MTTLQKIVNLNLFDFLRKIKDILTDLNSGSNGINTAFVAKSYASTITTAFDSDNPNIEIHLTGNLNLTLTGTTNGDSGLVNLYFSGSQLATLNGVINLVLLGSGVMIPVHFIHDSDGLKWYNSSTLGGIVYADDAAADVDSNLLSKQYYNVIGDRLVRRKP